MSLATLLETHEAALVDRASRRLGPDSPLGAERRALLRALVAALRTPAPPPSHSPAALDFEDLAREYALLRDDIFERIEESGALVTLPELRLLTGFITDAVARAARERSGRRSEPSESHLRVATDALPVLMSFIDAGERYRVINKPYEHWFGQPREALLGTTVLEMIGPAAYEKISPYITRTLAGEQLTFEQHRVPYRVAGVRDVKVTYVPHRDASGAVDGFAALLEDITLRRSLEGERDRLVLQRTEVLESMSDGFLAIDREWRVVQVNRRYEAASKRSREDIIGRSLREHLPPLGGRFMGECERSMKERVEVQLVEHDEATDTWTDVRAFPTLEGGLAAFFRDVTTEVRARETMRQRAELEEQLIGIVSHDLRNPLNTIALGAQILARREDLDESATKIVIRVRNAADRATRMVRDLLDFTQARLGGGLPVAPRATDAHAVVQSVIEEVEAAHPSRQIAVTQSGDGRGQFDPDRLAQAIENLVTNALKYSPAHSLVSVAVEGDAATLTISVHNGGDPITQERIFQPFQRAVSAAGNTIRSVGLGLYIVKQIVDAHHGSVIVASSAENGTTFTLRLPRQRALTE